MSAQLWAIVGADGAFTLHYTASASVTLADAGHADDCQGKRAWALPREPVTANGEGVDYATGAIDFAVVRVSAALVAEIKNAAATCITGFAPTWRQLNDVYEPSAPGATERRTRIDAVRAASDELEARAAAAANADDIRNLRNDIAALAAGELA